MGIVAAYVLPHPPLAVEGVAGENEKSRVKNTLSSFESIAKEISVIKPDTIIVSTPHGICYSDFFHISPGRSARGNFGVFGNHALEISAAYDEGFVSDLSRFCKDARFMAGTAGEVDPSLDHGTMVPLYFVNKYYRDYKLVRVSLSGMSLLEHFNFGKFIKKVADASDKKIVFIASGDLSHYQSDEGPYSYRPEGPLYDDKLMETLRNGELNELLTFDTNLLNNAGECGHRSFCIMAGALYDEEITTNVLSHEAPFGVGYGCATINIKSKVNKSDWEKALVLELERYYAGGTWKFTAGMEAAIMEMQDKDKYVLLARKTIDSIILGKPLPDPSGEDLPVEIKEKRAGAFVSIHKNGELRGCIGTIMATRKSLADEIIANAVSASTQDPRFPVVTEEELPFLDINVDVLSEPERVLSIEDLDAKKYGVIVSNGRKMGVLLPDLEGVDTVEMQINIAKRKAGIEPDEPFDIMRFSVERHI